MMQLFNSDLGVLRRDGDVLQVLAGIDDLHTLITDGRVDDARSAGVSSQVTIDQVRLYAPLRPARLFQVGLNYASHLAETGLDAPASPMYAVTEVTDQVSDPGATITFPADDLDQVDYECEVAVVIGAPADNVAADDAWGVIAGVTGCNDVSARGLQRAGFATGDLAAGKMLPGFKPLGPGLITTDEIVDRPIDIGLTLNGESRQQASSAEMVFSIPMLVEAISAEHALAPGDVIMTGSPAGVGIITGRFLQDGDVVEVTCGDLPPLRNHFAAP